MGGVTDEGTKQIPTLLSGGMAAKKTVRGFQGPRRTRRFPSDQKAVTLWLWEDVPDRFFGRAGHFFGRRIFAAWQSCFIITAFKSDPAFGETRSAVIPLHDINPHFSARKDKTIQRFSYSSSRDLATLILCASSPCAPLSTLATT
jgi:hypothetical protein